MSEWPKTFHITTNPKTGEEKDFRVLVGEPTFITTFKRHGTCRCTRVYPVVRSSVGVEAIAQGVSDDAPWRTHYICDCYGFLIDDKELSKHQAAASQASVRRAQERLY